MKIAQGLYEGVDIGGDTVGLITYMRTDGVTMAGEAITESRRVIGDLHGERYVPEGAARLRIEGEERTGSARGDPADELCAHAGEGLAYLDSIMRGSTS